MATEATTAGELLRERLVPALDTLEETVRQGRRMLIRGQHAAEDVAAGAVLRVRRRPLSAITAAVGAGALAGAVVGFALGWLIRPKECR